MARNPDFGASKKPLDDDNAQYEDSPLPSRRKDPRIFKIIVIGDSNVGKTCLTYRFCEGKFPSRVEATIGVDFRERTVQIGDDFLKLQIWDTAGQERFRKSMVPHYYRNVHAVVYVYDVTKRSTFDSLDSWLTEYRHYNLDVEVPRVLVGNKCDLDNLVQVGTNEAQCFADKYQMPLFETSAMDDERSDHTESIFMTIAHKLKESKPMMGKRYSLSNTTTTTKPQVIRYTSIGQERQESCSC